MKGSKGPVKKAKDLSPKTAEKVKAGGFSSLSPNQQQQIANNMVKPA